VEYPTTKPEETLGNCLKHLKEWNVKSLGIASFGPLDLEPGSKTYGYITTTPKPYWGNTDLLGYFSKNLPGVPIQIQTDVNAAAQSEMIYGKHHGGKNLNAVCYITVGTGVGCGITIFGKILKGFAHSESGHVRVPRHPKDIAFAGTCPYHKDCVEGLISAGAIAARLNMAAKDLKDLPDTHEVWDIVGFYLANLCISLTLIASPEVIVVGGGVLKRLAIYPHIKAHFEQLLNKYVETPAVNSYIVRSRFDDNAGTVGCLELGRKAYYGS
jgi:fructokinase